MHGGEYHMYNPDVIAALQAAVISGDYEHYKLFARLVNGRPASTFRDCWRSRAPRARSRSRKSSRRRRFWRALTRRHVPRRAFSRGARGARHRHEPSRRALQLR